MTLEDALVVYVHLQDREMITEREERALTAAREIIDREARKVIGSFPVIGLKVERPSEAFGSRRRTK